jgi:hypothetical protein
MLNYCHTGCMPSDDTQIAHFSGAELLDKSECKRNKLCRDHAYCYYIVLDVASDLSG